MLLVSNSNYCLPCLPSPVLTHSSQLSHISDSLNRIIRIDPFTLLPREVSLRILGYLDAISLGRAAQVSKTWKALSDDDLLWRRMCGQHIDRKCEKCGWGLPSLERRRLKVELNHRSPAAALGVGHHDHHHDGIQQLMTRTEALAAMPPKDHYQAVTCDSAAPAPLPTLKRAAPDTTIWPKEKKARLDDLEDEPNSAVSEYPVDGKGGSLTREVRLTRPWKSVYCERLVVERNWRKGRCATKTLKGHTDGVMCLQYHTALTSPSYPVLITGSYDRTVRVWNLDTGEQVQILRGHARAVRALQFDQMLLFTGSMDGTVRMWNWRKGECLRVFEGHTDGVVSLNYNGYLLASGSADSTVCVRNFRTGGRFFLRGHDDWVNQVIIWDGKTSPGDIDPTAMPKFTSARMRSQASPGVDAAPGDEIDVGTMLFSASDDLTIKLWDLSTQECIRTFNGHKGQIQSMRLLMVDKTEEDDGDCEDRHATPPPSTQIVPASTITNINRSATEFAPPGFDPVAHVTLADPVVPRVYVHSEDDHDRRSKKEKSPHRDEKCAVLVTGSLDGTVRLWDVDSGREKNTLFGHIEGVWAVDMDSLRLASGSHDRTIKVWDRQSGNCVQTFVGHRGAVTSLQLSDDMIVSGSEDGDVMVWSFAPNQAT